MDFLGKQNTMPFELSSNQRKPTCSFIHLDFKCTYLKQSKYRGVYMWIDNVIYAELPDPSKETELD